MDSIPAGWEDVAIFLYDGLGRLYGLGRGQAAQLALGQFELEARRWPEAARLYARARAMGDTVPGAVYGQMVSLGAEGRTREAFQLAESLASRWPDHPLAYSSDRPSARTPDRPTVRPSDRPIV